MQSLRISRLFADVVELQIVQHDLRFHPARQRGFYPALNQFADIIPGKAPQGLQHFLGNGCIGGEHRKIEIAELKFLRQGFNAYLRGFI